MLSEYNITVQVYVCDQAHRCHVVETNFKCAQTISNLSVLGNDFVSMPLP